MMRDGLGGRRRCAVSRPGTNPARLPFIDPLPPVFYPRPSYKGSKRACLQCSHRLRTVVIGKSRFAGMEVPGDPSTRHTFQVDWDPESPTMSPSGPKPLPNWILRNRMRGYVTHWLTEEDLGEAWDRRSLVQWPEVVLQLEPNGVPFWYPHRDVETGTVLSASQQEESFPVTR